MRHISDLFAKYRDTIQPPQATVEQSVRAAVEEVAHITLSPEMVQFKVAERVIFLQAPSVIKSEVKRREKAVLALVQKELGVTRAPTKIL